MPDRQSQDLKVETVRSVELERNTKETQIQLGLNLDQKANKTSCYWTWF